MTLPFHSFELETLSLHGGQSPDPTTGSRAVPIYQTTSYVFRDTEHAQDLFSLAEPGNIYSRIMNPTVDAFEQRMALLEDGVAAVATSSGMSAITLAILNIASTGDDIIASSNLYGGTYNLFSTTLPRYGINVNFVDTTDPENIRKAITPNTKAIFAETIGNPSLNVLDIEEVSDVAHENGIPFIIDNTFATPYVCKPLSWGADIVVHSATKWIGGHGTTIGGVVVDSGRFNWNSEKFPGFVEPDTSYNGIHYATDVGPAGFAIKLRVQLLRDIGACLSPQNAFLLLQGLETLPVRVEKHGENAKKIAHYLKNHPSVQWVAFPGLEDHPSHLLAKKYLHHGYGSIVVFGIKGGREEGRKVIDNISLWSHVANVGDAKSLIIHPASTTHQQLSQEELKKSGVTEELIRLSIGLESPNDLINDLEFAINQATGIRSKEKVQENVIEHALASSLYRTKEEVRAKSIAVVGAEDDDPSIKKLERLGFNLLPIHPSQSQKFGKQTFKSLGEIKQEVDLVYALTNSAAEKVANEIPSVRPSILWIKDGALEFADRQQIENQDIPIVSNLDLYQEAQRIRSASPIVESLHV